MRQAFVVRYYTQYTVSHKKEHQTFHDNCRILTDFQNSCIAEKRSKFSKQILEKIAPHLINVATLPTETLKFKFL